MAISVAMATYNGNKYIGEQIDSIIYQVGAEDELIISDDGSTDGTIETIKEYINKCPQIKFINGPKQGVVRNFMNALAHVKNEIVFLSDQDDIWKENKINRVKDCFLENPDKNLVLHNADLLINGDIQSGRLLTYRKGFFVNWLRSSYWGCCMAFRKEYADWFVKNNTCPFLHDQMLGLYGELNLGSIYLDEALIFHRFHDNNKSQSLPWADKIGYRAKLFGYFVKACKHTECLEKVQ